MCACVPVCCVRTMYKMCKYTRWRWRSESERDIREHTDSQFIHGHLILFPCVLYFRVQFVDLWVWMVLWPFPSLTHRTHTHALFLGITSIKNTKMGIICEQTSKRTSANETRVKKSRKINITQKRLKDNNRKTKKTPPPPNTKTKKHFLVLRNWYK